MTTLREAAQAVLDRWDSPAWEWLKQGPTAALMADLRAALAEPVQNSQDFGVAGSATSPWRESAAKGCSPSGIGMPATPPQRKPLTDEEIGKAAAPYYGTTGFRVEAFARAIERAHGIGGNT